MQRLCGNQCLRKIVILEMCNAGPPEWLTHPQIFLLKNGYKLRLPALEYCRLRADIIEVYKILHEIEKNKYKYFQCHRQEYHKRE